MLPLHNLLIAALCIAFSVTTARAAEEVENPQFASWSKFGVGSTATLVANMDGGMTMNSVRTLKEKADDRVVIEVTTTLDRGGKKEPTRPISITIKAKVDKAKAKELEHEKVEAGGKSYDCTIYAMEDAAPNYIGTKPKIWVSSDVPGGIVKVEMSTPRGAVTQILKTVEIKK